MQVIILAGGLGTRLREVVKDVPKPMADIAGKPFLALLLDYLKNYKITKVIISSYHLHEKITSYFGDEYEGIKISYSLENQLLGTGGAIINSLKNCDLTKPILVLNGDSFLQIDYKKFIKFHFDNGCDLSVALRKMEDCSRYGAVEINDQNKIISFKEKPLTPALSPQAGRGSVDSFGLINGGIYIINPKIFQQFNLPEKFSFEQNFLMKYLQDLEFKGFVSDDYFIDIGIPDDYVKAQEELPRIIKFLQSQNDEKYCNKALFLDRDGVINEDCGYVHKKEDFHFIDGIFDLCKKAQDKNYKIIIITNQSGIARGYYSEEQFLELTKWMENEFLKNSVKISKTFYCPFHIDGKIEKYRKNSFNRKPNPGMIFDAIEEFKIDTKNSILIGDSETDMQAAKLAKIGRKILHNKTKNYHNFLKRFFNK
ncbi:MAG TPA: D-glycero-beta-D-manno-heptose 1,7-bisphosphate 7-phosphatase [Rickettsiales bacterium]|nr:D-glycero-beta-D-manno-heptose 1,7-bisphosphate 7-phosphatase [Rickettsiales bacterium]